MAQFSPTKGKDIIKADIAHTTTYMLPTGNEEFDGPLFKALQENWTLSPLGDPEDLKGSVDLSDPKRTYIGYLDAGLQRSIAFIRGGSKNKLLNLDQRDILAHCSMGSVRNENTIEQCAYRLPLMVSTLQQTLKMRLTKDGDAVDQGDFNALASRLKGKTLLVERALLHDDEINMLKEEYKHPLEFVDREQVVDAIKEHRADAALLVLVFGSAFDAVVYDLASGECVFLVHVWQSQSLLKLQEKHVRRLSDLIDK